MLWCVPFGHTSNLSQQSLTGLLGGQGCFQLGSDSIVQNKQYPAYSTWGGLIYDGVANTIQVPVESALTSTLWPKIKANLGV